MNSNGNYATLGYYNSNSSVAPIAAPRVSTVVVPAYGGVGYDSLTHGVQQQGGCDNYFSIGNAYPGYPGGCNKFTTRLCK